MASIAKKKIGRGLYYYARECKRINGKPKVVWQKYLGRVEDILSAVAGPREAQPVQGEALVTEFGAVAALYDLSVRLRIAATIDRLVPKRGDGPSVGTYLQVASINRCVAPCSKARIGDWFEGTALRRLVPISRQQLTSQRFWDNMDRVSPEAISSIEAEVTQRAVREFGLDLSRVLFDATNFFTFIDTFNERCTLAQRGKSKEGRAALRIVGVALLVTADFHVPLLHQTYAGNQTDCPTFASLTDLVVERCRRLVAEAEHVTIVFDKGNNSQDNLDAMAATSYHFIGSLVPTQHLDLLAVPRSQFHPLSQDGLPGVSAYRTRKAVFGRDRTVLVTYNENLFVAQSKTLLREIGKRQQQFAELAARLRRWRTGEVRGGQPPTAEGTRSKVAAWLKARHMRDLFAVTISEQDGLPSLEYHFDREAWERLQIQLLGKTILFTDNDDWPDAQIVSGYRAQHHIESGFRQMKDPHCIALRPQRHWTDQKVRVHVFTCVLALMLLSLLRRTLHTAGIGVSIPRMVELLGGIREATLLFPPAPGTDTPTTRTSITNMSPEQQRIYRLLDLQRYASS